MFKLIYAYRTHCAKLFLSMIARGYLNLNLAYRATDGTGS